MTLMRRLAMAGALMLWACASPTAQCTDCSARGDAASVTIVAVGDTSGYNVAVTAEAQDPFEKVRHLLAPHDVFLFNFEGPILSTPPPPGACRAFPRQSVFWSGPWIAEFLDPTRVTIAALANNHIMDCARDGLDTTLRELSRRRIATVGADTDVGRACRPLRLELHGLRLAVVAYLGMKLDGVLATADRPGAASWERCAAAQQLPALARSADLVVAVLHLDLANSWAAHAPPEHIAAVERALAAGADIVIAHGPHVVQAVLERDGRLGLLSLGNFLLRPDYRMPERAHRSVIARPTVSRETVELDLIPLRLDASGRPYIPTIEYGTAILNDLAAQSDSVGTRLTVDAGVGRLAIERKLTTRR